MTCPRLNIPCEDEGICPHRFTAVGGIFRCHLEESHVTLHEYLPTCQYGVPAENENQIENCGLPASARWSWDGGKTWLYVCPDHNELVDSCEKEGDRP